MLETHIKVLATIYTALLMAAVSYVLLFGGFEIKSPVVKGKVIQATMVDISQLKSRSKPKEVKKQPKKDPPKQEPIKKDPPKKDPPKKEPIKKDPPKKDPPKKDPPRIVKKTPVVDTKAQELERKKDKELKKRKEELLKKKIAAEKRSKQAEQDLKDLANKVNETEKTEPQQNSGNKRGQSLADKKMRLMTQYQLAVISSVERQWSKPVSANENLLCRVKVRQMPGGGVIDATISTPCNANTIVRNSIIAAIKKADPLPYKGFESVFSRTATFTFKQSNE